MAILSDLTEEEKLCSRCGSQPRLWSASGRVTWCRACKNEWQRAYRAGVKLQKRVPKPKRQDGCLIWQGRVNKNSGYGTRTVKGKTVYVHRHAWELVNGPIPEGMTVDHLCEQKLCINVEHMELCSRGDNVKRYYERRGF